MKCSLIIPAYWLNKELFEMTVNCLNSINDTTDDEPQEVLIVDDGSPIYFELIDDTNFTQQMKTLHRETNGGYSAAANMGLFYATGDVLIIGNNDLTFPENWLEGLLYVLEEGFDIATCWTSDQKVKLEDRIEEGSKFGSLFAIKRKVYETLGGFDEQFKGYFADTDYRRRALNEGFKIGKNLNLVVHHEAKATYKVIDPNDNEFLRASRLYEIKWGAEE